MDEATVKNLLAPLFSQFGTADGDMAGKLMGYLIALEHSTPQALKAAVRSYLSGSVDGHDGKFIRPARNWPAWCAPSRRISTSSRRACGSSMPAGRSRRRR